MVDHINLCIKSLLYHNTIDLHKMLQTFYDTINYLYKQKMPQNNDIKMRGFTKNSYLRFGDCFFNLILIDL